ncbi:hypothetical protein [Tunicatimonas pelagia]|uniref:hypothetical protein n=1 Tax=Tunicatimonas pelagia TaxID=931531 RepID=UPI002665B88F|nr:hypothetical protein [Tunicatimonas pelagia]WKN44204.1 hypothetical protein P0M28_04385 [Tunicatimonas pelagia]
MHIFLPDLFRSSETRSGETRSRQTRHLPYNRREVWPQAGRVASTGIRRAFHAGRKASSEPPCGSPPGRGGVLRFCKIAAAALSYTRSVANYST